MNIFYFRLIAVILFLITCLILFFLMIVNFSGSVLGICYYTHVVQRFIFVSILLAIKDVIMFFLFFSTRKDKFGLLFILYFFEFLFLVYVTVHLQLFPPEFNGLKRSIRDCVKNELNEEVDVKHDKKMIY